MSSYLPLGPSRDRVALAYTTSLGQLSFLCMVLPVKGMDVLAIEPMTDRAEATPRIVHRDLESLLDLATRLDLSAPVRHALAKAVIASRASRGVRKRTFKGGLAAWHLRTSKEMLAGSLQTGMATSEVAAACRLSEGHFARAFRVSTGVSPTQWRVEERLSRCRSRLAESPDSIKSIALEAGFPHQSSFSRIFRQVCGVSPTSWRRAFRSATNTWLEASSASAAPTCLPRLNSKPELPAHVVLSTNIINRRLHDPALSHLCRAVADCVCVHGASSSIVGYLMDAIGSRIHEIQGGSAARQSLNGALPCRQEAIAKAMLGAINDDGVSVAQVARTCGMSSSQFSRRFKQGVGVGPQRWRMLQKIGRAQELLLLPHYSMTRAASECGFAEPSQFSHTFRKLVGEPPSVWRERHAFLTTSTTSAANAPRP